MFRFLWLAENASIVRGILDYITDPNPAIITIDDIASPQERLRQLQEEYRELSAELLLLQQQHTQLREQEL